MSKQNYPVTARLAVMTSNAAIAPIIMLEVDDVSSGARIFELELNPLTVGNLLTGSGSVAATLRHMNEDAVGKHLETDHVMIPAVDQSNGVKMAKEPDGGWGPWEQDGWKCNRSDFGNHHRRAGAGFSVSRSRLVDAESEISHKDRLDGRDVVVAQALDIAQKHLGARNGQHYLEHFLKKVGHES